MITRHLVALLFGSILLTGSASATRASNNPPTANFGYTTNGLTANFTDSSSDSDGTIVSHVWLFGDGSTSSSTNPSHDYKAAGTYSVTERVIDNGGASSTKATSVTVSNSLLTVNFVYTTNGLTANFTDISSESGGTIASHAWTFGDGGTSTAANPSHTYAANGFYSVSETVTDSGGATNTKTVSVGVSNSPPTANFVYTTNGLAANFTDMSSDSDGTIVSHAWTFGDGGTSTAANPIHAYAANGFYSVSETVTDNHGATNTKTVSVGVSNSPPTANFSYTTNGLTVNFADSSSDSDGTIASHAWTFGDGSTSTAASPSHAYATYGTYSVSETVTDNNGATNTKTSLVTMSVLPDHGLYTSYAFSNSFTYVGMLVCGSTAGSTGCYGEEGTTLGPFGHVGAMIEGDESVDTATNTVTRYIYIVDQAVASGTGTKLFIYKKTDAVSYATDTVTVTLANSMDLSLVGGTTAKTFLAANAGYLFIGTDQSPFALKFNKSTLAISQVNGYLPENLTAITADKYGYVSVTSESSAFSGVAVFDPNGNPLVGTAAFMLDTTNGYSTSGGPIVTNQAIENANRMQLKFKKPPSK